MGKERTQGRRLKPRRARGVESELAQPLAERLAAYALGAGAAGVGILTAAQPAEARIVYTPANIHFEKGALLDLDNDGTHDFLINQTWVSYTAFVRGPSLRVRGAPGNAVAGIFTSGGKSDALRLARGAKIGPGDSFLRNRNALMGKWSGIFDYYFFGYWTNRASGFLGFEFQIDGQAHYGWAEVLITGGDALEPFRGVVKGYAYDTVPNQPILAGQKIDGDWIGEIPPQPATLGLLALGAPGLDIWRRRQSP